MKPTIPIINAFKKEQHLENVKSILEDLLITNSHRWIICRIHTQVIPKLGVYITVLALSLSHLSSLLTPNALVVPISLNTERKSLSLISI